VCVRYGCVKDVCGVCVCVCVGVLVCVCVCVAIVVWFPFCGEGGSGVAGVFCECVVGLC